MIEAIFHGHSFVELQREGKSILIDPFIEGNTQCDKTSEYFIKKNLHAIIVTHAHFDHIGQTVEIAQATGCLVIATYELCEYFERVGIKTVSSQSIGGPVSYDGYGVQFTPALHGGGNYSLGISGIAAGVLVTIGKHTIYHAGDTGLTKEFELIGEYPIDVAFLPIGGRFTMDISQAVRSIQMLTPKRAVPIHFNTWEPIQQDANDFAMQVMQQGIAVPKVLRSGQMICIE